MAFVHTIALIYRRLPPKLYSIILQFRSKKITPEIYP